MSVGLLNQTTLIKRTGLLWKCVILAWADFCLTTVVDMFCLCKSY